MRSLVVITALGFQVLGLALDPGDGPSPQDRSMEVCDDYGYVYDVDITERAVAGTVMTNTCGEGVLDGTFFRGGEGTFCFDVRVTLDSTSCCPGYDMDGCWDVEAEEGYYTWHSFGGHFCTGTGTVDVALCDSTEMRATPPRRAPGVRAR